MRMKAYGGWLMDNFFVAMQIHIMSYALIHIVHKERKKKKKQKKERKKLTANDSHLIFSRYWYEGWGSPNCSGKCSAKFYKNKYKTPGYKAKPRIAGKAHPDLITGLSAWPGAQSQFRFNDGADDKAAINHRPAQHSPQV